jgi:dipeptidase D
LIQQFAQQIFAEAEGTDDNPPQFSVRNGPVLPTDFSLNFEETKKILNVCIVYQIGPLRWSPTFPEYVDTSDNLATVKFIGNVVELVSFPRSAVQSKLDETDQRIHAICEMSGLEYTVTAHDSGAPWTPNLSSRLAKLFADSFEQITGERKKLGITQVTIEPPEFLRLGYVIDMVAVSQSVPKAHNIGEYFDINEAITWRNVVFDVLSKLTS